MTDVQAPANAMDSQCERCALLASEAADPVLTNRQWALYPIKHPELFALAKQAVACFWTVDELDFSTDTGDFRKLSVEDRQALLVALSFFAQADGIVMENVSANYMHKVALPEAHYFYAMQMAMEAIHSEVYALMLDLYVSQEVDRARVLQVVTEMPSVQAKNAWAKKWIGAEAPVGVLLLASCCVEGIFFSSSFALIFFFRMRGLLPGLSMANDFIARDEGLHVRFAAALLATLRQKPSQALAVQMLREAAEVEKRFVAEMLPSGGLAGGFPLDSAMQHCEAMTDVVSRMCGYGPIFDAATPFDFMRMQEIEGKANFFEKRPSEYRKAAACCSPPVSAQDAFALVENF